MFAFAQELLTVKLIKFLGFSFVFLNTLCG